MKLFGIPNCDTVRKARMYYDSEDILYEFIDFKKTQIDSQTIENWIEQVGLTLLINTKSATYRALTEVEKQHLKTPKLAVDVILKNITVLKRPIISIENKIIQVGFNQK